MWTSPILLLIVTTASRTRLLEISVAWHWPCIITSCMDIEPAVFIRTAERDQGIRFHTYYRRSWRLRRICPNSFIQYTSLPCHLPLTPLALPLPASSTFFFFFSCSCFSPHPHVILPSPFNHKFQKSVPATLSVLGNPKRRSCLNPGADGTITIAMKNRRCYGMTDAKAVRQPH